jgi:hypothetical protein
VRARLRKCLLIAVVAVVLVLLASWLVGPDPRGLFLHEGMTEGQVRMLLSKPDYYDEPPDGSGGSAWFYCDSTSETIVEWNPGGMVRKVIFLH